MSTKGETMFYTFRQNNIGGYFSGPVLVCVECDSLEDANHRGELNGIRFGMFGSCECCGPRWSTAWDEDSLTETPTHYGDPLSESGDSWVIHYKDGTNLSGGKNRR